MGLLACEGEESTAPTINCAAGTALSASGDACGPNLSEGLSVNAVGEIVADTAGANTEAALAAAREEGRAAGIASVTPLNCAEGTAVNEAGDACEPTAEYRAAAVEEGRAAGFAAGRAEGVASVTSLNCAEGTGENEAGDACEPNLSVDVAIDDEDTIVPTDAYAERVCTDADGTFDAETGTCAPAYDCFRGGFCSQAARNFWFRAEDGNLYDGDSERGSGCDSTQENVELWLLGTEGASDGGWRMGGVMALCR